MKGYEKRKRAFARSLLTEKEIRAHTPIFGSAAWLTRRDQIAQRVKKQQDSAHQRALARKVAV